MPTLRIVLVSTRSDGFSAAVEQSLHHGLLARGYRLIEDAGRADVVARMSVSAAEKQAVQYMGFGSQPGGYSVHVAVVLAARGGDEVIDELEANTTSRGGGSNMKENPIAQLVEQIGSNGRLATYATNFARANRERAKREEQNAWAESGADACCAPASLDACDAIRAYLAAYPTGKHVDEATQCLEDAKPRLAALRVESDRKAATLAQQRRVAAALVDAKENALDALRRNDNRTAKELLSQEDGLIDVFRSEPQFKSTLIDSINFWLGQSGGDSARQVACGRDLYQRVLGRSAWGDLVRGVVARLGEDDPIRASKLAKQLDAGNCR